VLEGETTRPAVVEELDLRGFDVGGPDHDPRCLAVELVQIHQFCEGLP